MWYILQHSEDGTMYYDGYGYSEDKKERKLFDTEAEATAKKEMLQQGAIRADWLISLRVIKD
jgi:hypothetical protein